MGSEVPKCTSWLGHRFEARYSYGAPKTVSPAQLDQLFWVGGETRRLAISRITEPPATYEGDICVRCGVRVDKTLANTTV